jgi:inward rectifier potassium channel
MSIEEDGKMVNKFYSLDLELEKINALSLSWTLVHPLQRKVPCLNSLKMILPIHKVKWFCKTFDDMFSNTVAIRTSYTFEEVIYGVKFAPMYTEASTTQNYFYLDKLNSFTDAL